VGKTVVTTLSAASLRLKGIRVGVMKPVETGCHFGDHGVLRAPDAELLRKAAAAEGLISDHELCPYRFLYPVTPEIAAEKEGGQIDPQVILDILDGLKRRFDLVLVEGAGGLLAPVARDLMIKDLVRMIGSSLFVVGRAGLGTINHCLLTVRAALSDSIPLSGIVLNAPLDLHGGDLSVEDNARLISYYSGLPVWGPLPHDESVSAGRTLPWESPLLSECVSPLVDAIEKTSTL
ncbi:MAG: dethiobiotin synthase, partial [Thermodesulfobacteriota bacterium]|nr:dethiobiotin synthase [Thermodesulfobacteriota bacterium]